MDEFKQKITLDQMATYEIIVPGVLDERWSKWIEGTTITVDNDDAGLPVTTLTYTLDQAALQGLLRRLYSLGLPLISVNYLDPNQVVLKTDRIEKDGKMKRPFMLWPLVIVLILLSLGGFSGGIPMLADPVSGGYLDFEYLLPQLPVSNFILPGLFLIAFMGLFPLLLVYALIARPTWPLVDKWFHWSRHYWAWTGTILLAVGIAIWLGYEGWLVGWWPITYITAVQGALILFLALLPNVRKFYVDRAALH